MGDTSLIYSRDSCCARIRYVAGLLLVSVLGCDAPPQLSHAVEVADSSGVAIVEYHEPVWVGPGSWSLGDVPILEVGADTSNVETQLFNVKDVLPLAGGGFVISSAGGSELLLFDTSGDFQRRVGSVGDGPGEFRVAARLFSCAGDTIVVYHEGRVTVFDGEGSFQRSGRLPRGAGEARIGVHGVASDCSALAMGSRVPLGLAPRKVGALNHRLFWGDLSGTYRDTIVEFGAREVVGWFISGMLQPLSLPWARDAKWTVQDDRLYLGLADRSEIQVFQRGGGLSRVVRLTAEPPPVSASDRSLYGQRREHWLSLFPQLSDIILSLDEFPLVPEAKPPFFEILLDGRGNIWLRRYPTRVAGRPDIYGRGKDLEPPPDDQPEASHWVVLSLAAEVPPAVVITPPEFDIRAVSGAVVFGIWTGDHGVQTVRIYTVDPSGS